MLWLVCRPMVLTRPLPVYLVGVDGGPA
jgi:hypothetical protein